MCIVTDAGSERVKLMIRNVSCVCIRSRSVFTGVYSRCALSEVGFSGGDSVCLSQCLINSFIIVIKCVL